MFNLLPLVLVCFAVLVWWLARQTIIPSCVYFIGWAAGIACSLIGAANGELPPVGELGRELILNAMIGAVIGAGLSTMWIRIADARPDQRVTKIKESRLRPLAVCVIIATSMLALWRWRATGFATSLSELRLLHVSNNDLDGIRLTHYATILTTVVSALVGYSTITTGRSLLRGALELIMLSVPLGLVSGGRSWLLVPIVFLVFPLLFLYRLGTVVTIIKNQAHNILIIVAIFVLGFAYLGYARLKDNVMGSSLENVQVVSQIRSYLGISVSAVESYSGYAESTGPYNGRLSFEFFGKQLSRFGVGEEVDWLYGARADVAATVDYRLGSTHSSYIPRFVGDFGRTWLLALTAAFVFLLDIVFIYTIRQRLFGFFIALQMWLAAAFSFQEFNPSTGAFWLGFPFCAAISWVFTDDGPQFRKWLPIVRQLAGGPPSRPTRSIIRK